MRVAISALRLTTGDDFRKAGVGRHAIEVINALGRRKGPDHFEILLAEGVRAPEEWYKSPSLTVHETTSPPKKFRRFWEHFTTEKHARRLGVDANFALYSVVPFRPQLPTIGMIHDAFPKTHPELFVASDARRERFFQSTMCRYSDLVITISNWSREELSRSYQTPIEKFRVVPNGLGNPLEKCRVPLPDRSNFLLENCPFDSYLFTLSTIEPRKNLKRLLEAFSLLRRESAYHDLGLLVGGGMGWKQHEIYDQTARMGLQDAVRFLGYVPDGELQSLYEHSRAFVFPSLLEGFGIPVLEAMTVGVPVVTSNTSALPDVAADAAFYCDPMQVESITGAIRECLSNQTARTAKIELGVSRSKLFTWDKAADQLVATFSEARQVRPDR